MIRFVCAIYFFEALAWSFKLLYLILYRVWIQNLLIILQLLKIFIFYYCVVDLFIIRRRVSKKVIRWFLVKFSCFFISFVYNSSFKFSVIQIFTVQLTLISFSLLATNLFFIKLIHNSYYGHSKFIGCCWETTQKNSVFVWTLLI